MIFSQLEFFFLMVVVFGFLSCVRNMRAQHLFLLLISVYFYAYWDWRFAAFLCGSTVCDYFLGLLISKAPNAHARRAWLTTSVVLNLSVLGFFKYYNFFVTSATVILNAFGWHPHTLSILLPAGISFWTFQKLCYTIDVYRGTLVPCRRLTDFAMYVMFFPQLVAGPIVRASDFLPQLKTPRLLTRTRAYEGFRLFVFGFFKKVFIADNLAVFVDCSFENAPVLSGATLWLATISYAIQIYCDFSGYSDMAIGVARAMGYDFRANFNLPYVSCNITEFWRRWHISLSTWLRDYLYIPLGGNRKGRVRTYINLMLTMLLGGLWHGANWTFVFWGGLHGAALAVHKAWTAGRRNSVRKEPAGWQALLGWAATMLVVLVGWVFFRAGSFPLAANMLHRMFTLSHGVSHPFPFAFAAIGFMLVPHVLFVLRKHQWSETKADSIFDNAVLCFMFGLAVLFYPTGFKPFIYFQF